jgi:hypothetical protein
MDAHEREYAGAVAGMQEAAGLPVNRQIPADGDFVSGKTAGKHWSGHVEWVSPPLMCLNVGGAWAYVPVGDITH